MAFCPGASEVQAPPALPPSEPHLGKLLLSRLLRCSPPRPALEQGWKGRGAGPPEPAGCPPQPRGAPGTLERPPPGKRRGSRSFSSTGSLKPLPEPHPNSPCAPPPTRGKPLETPLLLPAELATRWSPLRLLPCGPSPGDNERAPLTLARPASQGIERDPLGKGGFLAFSPLEVPPPALPCLVALLCSGCAPQTSPPGAGKQPCAKELRGRPSSSAPPRPLPLPFPAPSPPLPSPRLAWPPLPPSLPGSFRFQRPARPWGGRVSAAASAARPGAPAGLRCPPACRRCCCCWCWKRRWASQGIRGGRAQVTRTTSAPPTRTWRAAPGGGSTVGLPRLKPPLACPSAPPREAEFNELFMQPPQPPPHGSPGPSRETIPAKPLADTPPPVAAPQRALPELGKPPPPVKRSPS